MSSPNSADTVRAVRRVTAVGIWINALLVAMKLFFGYTGHSDALVADGYHSMSDFATDIIVIAFVAASYKAADSRHPYGHGKFETIATVLIGLVLLGVGFFIGAEGVGTLMRTLRGEVLPRPETVTLYIAAASVALKEGCYRYTLHQGRRLDSSALIANAWHHRSDAVSSLATIVGVGFAIFLGAQWRVMDPVASILIAVMICVSAVKIMMPPINELLEASLPAATMQRMEEAIAQVPGVIRMHNLRARRNGHSTIVDVNIHVDPNITVQAGHAIATAVERKLEECIGRDVIIYVHVEPEKQPNP